MRRRKASSRACGIFGAGAILFILAFSAVGREGSTAAPVQPVVPPGTAKPEPGELVVAVVRDGPSLYFDNLIRQVEKELRGLQVRGKRIVLRHAAAYDAGWNPALVPEVVQRALDEKETGLVLAAGVMVTEYCLHGINRLARPVIAASLQDADTLALPVDEAGHSTRPNLNFVVSPITVGDDLRAFRRLVAFERLHVLVDRVFLQAFSNEVSRYVGEYSRDLGIDVFVIPVDARASSALSRLQDGSVQAVYITPLFRMKPGELRRLVSGINDLGLPSFSMLGFPEVELGVLAGISPPMTERLGRRLALNIQQFAAGQSLRELPTRMVLEKQLVVNGATAARIGLDLDLYALVDAEILHPEMAEPGRPLNLQWAVESALENDAGLGGSRAELAAARARRGIAASALFPNAEAQASHIRVDHDRARASLGLLPSQRTAAGVTLNQVLFDEGLISRLRATHRLAEEQRLETEAVRLGVIAGVCRRYLELLEARAVLRVERENLLLIRRNLELARLRRQVGSSGPEEVYRWESEEARGKGAVLDALSAVRAAEVAINEAMGLAQDQRWKPEDMVLAPHEYGFLGGRLDDVLGDGRQRARLQEIMVEMAISNSPALAAIDQALESARITRRHARRRFYSPTVSAWFSYEHELDASRDDASSLGETLPRQDDDDWTLGVRLAFPIFEGGGRFFELRRAGGEVRRLEELRRDTRRRLEQSVRSALVSLVSSHAEIGLSQLSRDRARQNLELVRRKYAAGDIAVTELLDAQDQVLIQERAAALAVYRYFRDLVDLQQAIAWFEVERSEEEKEQLAEWIIHELNGDGESGGRK